MGLSPLNHPSTISVFEFFIHLFYQAKDLVPAHLFYSTGDKMLGQELPGRTHFIQEIFYILADGTLVFFIGFGEYEAEGDLPFAQFIDEFKVVLLGTVAAVDEDENCHQVFPFAKIIFDHFLPFLPTADRDFGKTVTGEIDNIPFIVDIEMIDELCLTRRAGGLGQPLIIGNQVDQRGFADIAAADEGIFRPVRFRTLGVIRAADHVYRGIDNHIAK